MDRILSLSQRNAGGGNDVLFNLQVEVIFDKVHRRYQLVLDFLHCTVYRCKLIKPISSRPKHTKKMETAISLLPICTELERELERALPYCNLNQLCQGEFQSYT